MQIIGAGFGRTGTMSLKAALEELGFGPCYHMVEVLIHPSHIKTWQLAADGEKVDWRIFFKPYQAVLDYPAVAFYKDLIATFPEAKVILTVRDADRWYESTFETIYQGTAIPAWLTNLLPPFRGLTKMVDDAIWQKLFAGRFEEKPYAIQVYKQHVAEVARLVPGDKLLVFQVKDGWKPLCEFLGLPIPNKAFPHINDRQMTKRLYLAARIFSVVFIFGFAFALWWLINQLF